MKFNSPISVNFISENQELINQIEFKLRSFYTTNLNFRVIKREEVSISLIASGTTKDNFILFDLNYYNGINQILHIKKECKQSKSFWGLIISDLVYEELLLFIISLKPNIFINKEEIESFKVKSMFESIRNSNKVNSYLSPKLVSIFNDLYSEKSLVSRLKDLKAWFDSSSQLIKNISKSQEVNLSKMQSKVLQKLAEGKTTKEISKDLFLSTNTINSHLKAIYSVLGVSSRIKAVRKGIELKIVSL